MRDVPPAAAPSPSPHGAAGSKTDTLRALSETTSVSDIMTRSVVCLSGEARVDAVTDMFLERGISSAPVVDAQWHPVGMVSKTDLLRAASEDGGIGAPAPPAPPGAPAVSGGEGHSQVRDIVTPYVLSLHEEAPIAVAAALMAYEGVHRLPVVASGGEVVGMISTLDIVKWAARATDLAVG